jgi:hypothetical protein
MRGQGGPIRGFSSSFVGGTGPPWPEPQSPYLATFLLPKAVGDVLHALYLVHGLAVYFVHFLLPLHGKSSAFAPKSCLHDVHKLRSKAIHTIAGNNHTPVTDNLPREHVRQKWKRSSRLWCTACMQSQCTNPHNPS